MKNRLPIIETLQHLNQSVTVAGWVQTRRDHGKIVFLDLRDRTGLLQIVAFEPNLVHQIQSENVGREFVVQITGKIVKRDQKLINPHLPTGTIELHLASFTILNPATTPPFEIEDQINVDEEVRMQYRYLDLRRPTMLKRFQLRHQVIHFIRNWLTKQNFIEVETPMLTKDTPEGAREYIVPSRLHPGKGYALPQSPQQFKQLLMVAGFERYFQIAKCLRDEDPRGDRQPEFTQLDLEMSFVDREDVMALNEELLIALVEKLTPHKIILTKPFPRMTYTEAMSKYKTDRPDLRKDPQNPNELAFVWIVDFPFFEKDKNGKWTFTHNPFSAAKPESEEYLKKEQNIEHILTTQYDVVLNGYEIGGGSIRNHQSDMMDHVFKIMGLNQNQINQNFGHMRTAFSYGAPPHGGIAWGLDRLVMLLADLPNIREVIAFPKTGDGRDLMMNAPATISAEKLKELHLKNS